MREILFRGKLADGNWSEGNLKVCKNGVYIITPDETIIGEYGRVIPETVGQYTGLTANGKKIFEGDIVKIYLFEPKGFANYEIGFIKYDETKIRFVFCTEEGKYSVDDSNEYEVIGNIHDNPDLLKGETK